MSVDGRVAGRDVHDTVVEKKKDKTIQSTTVFLSQHVKDTLWRASDTFGSTFRKFSEEPEPDEVFCLPDIGADELRTAEDGTGLCVGGASHRFVIDRDEEIARSDATVPVDGPALGHRRDQHSAGATVHHFDVNAERISAFLDLHRPLQGRR